MDFHQVVQTRRSVRAFKPDPIPDDVLRRVLETARLAPSANNKQPWHVVVVKDEARRREIARLCYAQNFIAQAPVVLVVCAQRYTDRYSWIAENLYLVDAAIFTDHLALAARAEGLGTCWIGAFDAAGHKALRELIALPDSHCVFMVMPIGYPARLDAFRPATARKPLAQIADEENFTPAG